MCSVGECWLPMEDCGRQAAVVVLTKYGYAPTMESYLESLKSAQDAQYATRGRFTTVLPELGYFGMGIALPAAISLSDIGWSAMVENKDLELRCLVSGTMPDSGGAGESAPARCISTR